jgi:hypothetical protein
MKFEIFKYDVPHTTLCMVIIEKCTGVVAFKMDKNVFKDVFQPFMKS